MFSAADVIAAFVVGSVVTGCAIIGTEVMMLGVGSRLFVRVAKWAVREMRSAWDGK